VIRARPQIASIEDRLSRRVDFPIVRANNALAIDSVTMRATVKRMLKGLVIVLTPMATRDW
jgi:hypothetical protein